ncbi:anti-sigma factor [Bacillus cereus group sp. BfR-BA-01383]|uniref:anti-sigma factor n=1 Tax=Bacillus cereus group sp. BfR-BA-01383 TaxID=2920327 RepID=UPI001F591E22|nr:anti-sigma factor [Bacillus cereus group sp. BfR-BA-01383]
MKRECDHLLSYVTNTFDDREQRKFQEHLKTCPKCQAEYSSMQAAWEALHFDFEENEVPATLKAEVFDFIFVHEQTSRDNIVTAKLKEWTVLLRKQFTPLAMVLLGIMLVITVALTIENSQLKIQSLAKHELSSDPIKVISTRPLVSSDQNHENTKGYIFVMQQGDKKKLVVQADHLPQVKNSEVYQVWLLKDGERKNAGIFKPDETGSGLLTYEISQKQSFDNVGITIEPDSNSTKPLGKKVLGT